MCDAIIHADIAFCCTAVSPSFQMAVVCYVGPEGGGAWYNRARSPAVRKYVAMNVAL